MKKSHLALIIGAGIVVCLGSIFLYLHFMSIKKSLVRIAKAELKKWSALTERSSKVSEILLNYWKSVGLSFTEKQMQSESFQSSYPWSSAFISYLFHKAGANEKFPYSSAHSGYFQYAKKNRDNKTASLRGFRITEYAPQVGDLVVYTRQTGKGYDSTGYFPSHGELVIEKGAGYILAVGGNVSNTVKATRYTIDAKGMLTTKEKPFFMVIQNNIR